jgi:hypothetical protein
MNKKSTDIIKRLLKSPEPSIKYKTRVFVLGESKTSRTIRELQREIKNSVRVGALLSHRDAHGRIEPVQHVYKKWSGAHWILASLADIGYPGDRKLTPVIDQVLEYWLLPRFTDMVVRETPIPAYKDKAVPIINGRARRCASQQGNALYAALSLGFEERRTDRLAHMLLEWQWPDGGWNCDRKPAAAHSSFWESIIPLRALSLYAEKVGSKKARAAAQRAATLFLRKHLYRRERNGAVMNSEFVKLHYPLYWRYDILHGLKVMAESGFIHDKRCEDALDLLEEKRLPDGGWPAEARFYQNHTPEKSNFDLVDWGGVSKKSYNEWVTVDALFVLNRAGRI